MNDFEVFKYAPGIFSENHHESALHQDLPNLLRTFYQPLPVWECGETREREPARLG